MPLTWEAVGIKVGFIDLTDGPKGISGKPRGVSTMLLQSSMSQEEQAFTAAHEACHFILGGLRLRQEPEEYNWEKRLMLDEYYCDQFAYNLGLTTHTPDLSLGE